MTASGYRPCNRASALARRCSRPAPRSSPTSSGADAVLSGKRTRPSGVIVSGNRLTIRLTKAAPDFLARFSMPFFCSIPDNLPIDPAGVPTPPAAGPYYIASKTPDRLVTVKRNPFYRGTARTTSTRWCSR